MKKGYLVILVIALGFGLVISMTGLSNGGVLGTPHDPSATGVRNGTNGAAQHVCESCHTPHNAMTYPLWNRNMQGHASTFTMYNSPTFDEKDRPADYMNYAFLGYQSKLCFACHDGVISTIQAKPSPLDPTVNYQLQILNPDAIMASGDLRNTHPVGFLVNLALDYNGGGRSGLNTLTVSTSAITGNSGSNTFPLYPDPTGTSLTQGTFQCATCHSVHNTPDVPYDPALTGDVYFLRVSNFMSQMCAECHPLFYYN